MKVLVGILLGCLLALGATQLFFTSPKFEALLAWQQSNEARDYPNQSKLRQFCEGHELDCSLTQDEDTCLWHGIAWPAWEARDSPVSHNWFGEDAKTKEDAARVFLKRLSYPPTIFYREYNKRKSEPCKDVQVIENDPSR